jgi:(p)ppGpp synthase/HD superfamily hydrolase
MGCCRPLSVTVANVRVVADATAFPSKSQIEKAGKYLRDLRQHRATFDFDRYLTAINIVTAFRDAHGYPMTKVRNGLASMINTEGLDAALSQRHKRVPRIIRKLERMPTNLARLEDIGGCRIVVKSPADMDAICRRIRKNWSSTFKRDRDYVETPKEMGYRARHFVVVRDGRSIEIQVRTVGQQRWADAVESADARHKLMLKDEDGPEALKEYFAIAAEVIYRGEFGHEVGDELRERLRVSNAQVIADGFFNS